MLMRPGQTLFVDSEGRGCTKGAVVETLRAAVVLTGAAIFDPVGKHLYTGHAFRITGACILSLWGLDAITIQLLGRWGSMAILSYIAEAPLTDLALRLMNEGAASLPQRLINAEGSVFRDLTCYIDMLQETLQRVVQLESGLKAFHGSLCKKAELALVEALTDRVDHTETVLDGMSISLEESAGSQPWYVLNEESRALHRASVDIQSSTRSWTTLCGWPFAGLSYVSTYVREEPHTSFRRCHTCTAHLSPLGQKYRLRWEGGLAELAVAVIADIYVSENSMQAHGRRGCLVCHFGSSAQKAIRKI